jgi:O-antigen/teichoic acid export membrane protein
LLTSNNTHTSIEHRAIKNFSVNTLSFVFSLLQTLITVPVLLKYWGNSTYGTWLVLFAGFNLLQTLDLGHQNFVGNQLNVVYHKDKDQFKATLGSSLLIAYFLGAIELFACLALIYSNKLHLLLGITPREIADSHSAMGLVLLMVMWLTFGSVGGIIVRIMIPAGMLYESQWLGILTRLTQFLSVISVAFLGGSILDACFWYAVLQSVMSFLILWYIKVKLPGFFPWWRLADWRTGFGNFKRSLVLTFNSIAQQLANNGLTIFIATLFSAALLPSFSTLRTLTNTAGAVTTIIITALLPDLIRFHATLEKDKLLSTINANWFISGIAVNSGILLMLPFVEYLYRLWTKGNLQFNPSLFLLLAVTISLANFGAGLNTYLMGINDLSSQTIITIARVVSLFLVSYAFSANYGLVSIGIGCVVSETIASVILPFILTNRRLISLSTRLSYDIALLSLLPSCMLLIGVFASLYFEMSYKYISWLLAPVLLNYYCNWKMLDDDVRSKLRQTVNIITAKFSWQS